MPKTRTKVAETKTTIPAALAHDSAALRRDLEAAVDAIVPLLARVHSINVRAVDVAESIDGITDDMRMASEETYSEVSRQAGLDELDKVIQRLLAALQARNEVAGVGELKVTRIVA